MADKKKVKKTGSTKPATKTKTTKPAAKPVKKVDIVEEAKKELKKMEEEQAKTQAASKKESKFAWSTFIGAVLLTCAAFILGGMIKENMQKRAINKYLSELITGLGGGMTVENISKLENVSDLFQFKIKFSEYDDEFTSAITKDGKFFFSDMSLEVPTLLEEIRAAGDQTSNASSTSLSCDEVTKTENPNLEVYVSSDCGYCKQAETEIASAVKQVPALAEHITLRYAGTTQDDGTVISFLGSEESGTENLRQVCIREKNPTAFWNYVACMADGGKTETCQSTAGVSTNLVDTCMADGSGLAAIKADQTAATNLAIQGTPSFFVNGTESVSDIDFGGRVPDSFKEIVCCSSTNPGSYCETTLE
ncbi:MAG: thioredoxin domain-containing protein [bacterium]|nr:thioredoxin domain-containing protein [bacterium]